MSTLGAAIITGAGQGIGRAIALRLAQDGYNILLNDLESNKTKLEEVAHAISEINTNPSASAALKVITVYGDVSNESDVENLVGRAVEEFGALDVMIANAGIVFHSLVTETKVEDWEKLFSVNVRGTMLCYKHAGLQMMKQGKGGRIVGAASTASKVGQPYASAYVASKFAVRGLTQSTAMELGQYGITVNAYAPGAIETTFLGRFDEFHSQRQGTEVGLWTENLKPRAAVKKNGQPEDVASLVSYLVSKEAHFITGQSILVDGGTYFD